MLRSGFIVFLSLFAMSCNEIQQAVKEAKNEIPPPPRDNYIILLDLSDRILENNQQQISKDLTVIKNIYGMFKSNLNKKDPSHLYYALNDKLKILIAPQKTTPGKLYEESGLLRVDLSAEQPEKKSRLVQESEKTFNSIVPDVYRQALVSKHTSGYAGADIWKYFNEDLSDDLDKDAQNTLFIITDGYLDFEKTEDRPNLNNRFTSCAQIINNLKSYPDWNDRFDKGDYGLMPVAKKFPRLRVVLVQMNPSQEWSGEYPLLTRIWSKWFKEMSIDSFGFIKNDHIGEVRETIEKFMHIKINGKIESAAWTAIDLPDSNALAQKNSYPLEKESGTAGNVLSAQAFKKKDKPTGNDSTNTYDKIAARNSTVKRPIKQKEQVSFGPVY
ncbi:MAG TPA: hypothetical protein VEV87_01945 [Chitinophagaceae bacterium]|nr:hypothetical protein [Chitinophagaceae bacterium]